MTPLQTFLDALDAAGIAGDIRSTILYYWSQGDWEQIRYTFTDWCTSARVARKLALGVNPNAEHALSDGFKDGCLQEVVDREIRHGTSEGNWATPTLNYLWTPSWQDVTYAFLQGTGQATPYRKKRVADTFAIWNARANFIVKEIPWGPTDIRI